MNPEKSLQMRQIALASIHGVGPAELQKNLAMDARDIARLKRTDEYKTVVEDICKDLLDESRRAIRSNFSELSHEILRVIRTRLVLNDLDAVKIVLKTLGFNDTPEGKVGDSKLIVNFQMPDAVQKVEPLTIEVKGEHKE